MRRYRAGEAGIAAMLDDYAFFTQALLDLYETDFDFTRINQAVGLDEPQAAGTSGRQRGWRLLLIRSNFWTRCV